MTESSDLDRLRQEYQKRKLRNSGSDIYSYLNPSNLFLLQSRERAILRALEKHGCTHIEREKILEIGCGSGGVLRQFMTWGAPERHLYGVDLLHDRLADAKNKLAEMRLVNANGEMLPFSESYFDLVLQFTAFSSILDRKVKVQVAQEMLRVLNPHGFILWYDFWLNPTNKQTRGIKPAEVKSLFPGCRYEFYKITLAPPITRLMVRFSWLLASIFEGLKVFNSHYLVMISKA